MNVSPIFKKAIHVTLRVRGGTNTRLAAIDNNIFDVHDQRTFSVIQPVHAEDHFNVVGHVQKRRSFFRQLHEPVEWYTDRQGFHLYGTSGEIDQHVGPVHTATESSAATVDKVQTVIFDVESGEIVRCIKYIIVNNINNRQYLL